LYSIPVTAANKRDRQAFLLSQHAIRIDAFKAPLAGAPECEVAARCFTTPEVKM
jgi:hypothetical protein